MDTAIKTKMTRFVGVVVKSKRASLSQLVVTLLKLHGPAFLKNKFNFPGGHIEEGETPIQAAIREVGEECGLVLKEEDMVQIAMQTKFIEGMGDTEFYVFAAVHDDPSQAKALTDEPILPRAISEVQAELLTSPEKFSNDFGTLLGLALAA